MNLQNQIPTQTVYLGIGTNLGARERNLLLALHLIEAQIGVVSKLSSIYKTEPWGYKEQPYFLNQCIRVETPLSPHALLQHIHLIEDTIGRKRSSKWGERSIDIDILFYGKQVIDHKDIKIPHPYIHLRKFVLYPLVEIAPAFEHPVFLRSIQQLFEICPDQAKAEIAIRQHYELPIYRN